MDVNSNIEFILNRANESFRNFEEELNARFNRSSSVISGSSTSARHDAAIDATSQQLRRPRHE